MNFDIRYLLVGVVIILITLISIVIYMDPIKRVFQKKSEYTNMEILDSCKSVHTNTCDTIYTNFEYKGKTYEVKVFIMQQERN